MKLLRPCRVLQRKYLAGKVEFSTLHEDAFFHQFSMDSDEGSNYPIAIVELPSGKIITTGAELIEFKES